MFIHCLAVKAYEGQTDDPRNLSYDDVAAYVQVRAHPSCPA